MINNPYYIKTKIEFSNDSIEVDIVDKKNGFDVDENKNQYIENLILLNIIEKSEVKQDGVDEVYDTYSSNFRTLEPLDLTGYIYYKKCYDFASLSNYKLAVQNIEKAILICPNNNSFIINYKFYLSFLLDACQDYSEFLPYFKNSLFLLSSDASFTNNAVLFANYITYELIDEHRDFDTAIELLYEFKTLYINQEFIDGINKIEDEGYYMWIANLMVIGEVDSAYLKISNLYEKYLSSKKYQDLFIQVSCQYCKNIILKRKDYSSANKIMESLLKYENEYPIIKDTYIQLLLSPFQLEYRFVEKSNEEALELAKKAYKFAPKNQLSLRAVSSAYHEKAMIYIRKNKLKKAFNILVEGLEFVPNDKLLNEDLAQLKESI